MLMVTGLFTGFLCNKFLKKHPKLISVFLIIACNFIKKETPVQVFSCEFYLITPFFYRTPAFSSFIFDLLWLQKQPFADVLQNNCSWEFWNIHRKTPVLEPSLNKATCWSLPSIKLQAWWPPALLKIQLFFCEYCKIFKNSFFIEHPRLLLLLWLLSEGLQNYKIVEYRNSAII